MVRSKDAAVDASVAVGQQIRDKPLTLRGCRLSIVQPGVPRAEKCARGCATALDSSVIRSSGATPGGRPRASHLYPESGENRKGCSGGARAAGTGASAVSALRAGGRSEGGDPAQGTASELSPRQVEDLCAWLLSRSIPPLDLRRLDRWFSEIVGEGNSEGHSAPVGGVEQLGVLPVGPLVFPIQEVAGAQLEGHRAPDPLRQRKVQR